MTVSNLQQPFRSSSYDPKKWWSITAQPMPDYSVQEYLGLAEAAQDDLVNNARNFLSDNDFSFIEINHDIFTQYEKSKLNFREWLENFCDENRLDKNVDFLMVGPRVKAPNSAERKASTGELPNDRIVDYLGIMFVSLKQNPKAKKIEIVLKLWATRLTQLKRMNQQLLIKINIGSRTLKQALEDINLCGLLKAPMTKLF